MYLTWLLDATPPYVSPISQGRILRSGPVQVKSQNDLSLLGAGLGPLVISERLELNDEVFAVAQDQPFLIPIQISATTLMANSETLGRFSSLPSPLQLITGDAVVCYGSGSTLSYPQSVLQH